MGNTKDIVITIFNIGLTWEAIGISFTLLFSLVNLLKSIIDGVVRTRENKKQVRINYITDKRIDWINKVRDTAAEYVSLVMDITGHAINSEEENKIEAESYPAEEFRSNLTTLIKKLYSLQLLLNFNGYIDAIIIKKTEEINDDIRNGKYSDANIKSQLIIVHLQIYLKSEWNRVKKEAEFKSYNNDQILIDIIKLYKSYPASDKLLTNEIETTIKDMRTKNNNKAS